MHSFAARLASFTTIDQTKNRRVSFIPRDFVPWPHPPTFLANPETLADAGFYHEPSPFDPDNVCCFLCGKELGEWEEQDDPFQIHAQKCPKCPWVLLNFAVAMGDGPEKESNNLPPLSNILYKARLATYGSGRTKWWPHDKSKIHGASSKAMALAGFIYNPESTDESEDTATCLYCDTTLSGWEETDDPIVEHRRHASDKQCEFLISLQHEEEGSEPSYKNESSTKKGSKGRRKTAAPKKQPRLPLTPLDQNKKETTPAPITKVKPLHPTASAVKNTARARASKAILSRVPALKQVDPAGNLQIRPKPFAVPLKEPPKVALPPLPSSDPLFPKDLNITIRGRFTLCGKLGSGTFGQVYRAKDNKYQGKVVAVKLEGHNAEYKSLEFEASVYRVMKSTLKPRNVPKIMWSGPVLNGDGIIMYQAVVMTLLGPSLETLWAAQGNRFRFCTVMGLAQQMISAIEWVHDQRVIHRDIKPDNFVIGLRPNNINIYLIDFGLAKVYSRYDGHIPYRTGKSFVGNYRFASVATLSGTEPSRRDDLESIAYVLIYLLVGDLPWRRHEKAENSIEAILGQKLATNLVTLCPDWPQLGEFVQYGRYLKYAARPDYDRWKNLFKSLKPAPDRCPQHISTTCKFEWVRETRVPS